jgi:hypothetical protein
VDIRVSAVLTDVERGELDVWIRNSDEDDEIEYVTVDAGAVAIHARHRRQSVSSAIAIRHSGRLIPDLNEALATLRGTP